MNEVSLNSEPACDDEAEEYEIDGECAMTEYVGQAGNILQGDNPLPPSVGMEFESYDDVYYFYNCYAKQQGFGVRVSNTWYRKSKEKYRGKLSCSSAGFKKKTDANRPRPETRTGCPAMIKFRLMENKRWRIIEIELDHNHLTTPCSGNIYKSHRIMDLGSKRPLPINCADDVHKIRLFRTVVIDAEDNNRVSNFDENEFRNHIDLGDCKLKLKPGDARELLDFFTRMQLNSPSFFYVMDINEKGCSRNVFWADQRCRGVYNYFGDVVFIDTTSLIEKFDVPLVVFTGINHHGQAVPLGCGLVSGETVESFIWLFRAWLTYMIGRPPQTVITSQCKALQTAIAEVFPRAFHCLSLTDVMKMVSHELVGVEQCDAIRKGLARAVYHSLSVDEFEAAWGDIVESYKLTNLEWLRVLHEDRKRWAPVYLKEVFLAGIVNVKENERLLTLPFKDYLTPHTCLSEFLRNYDQALLEIEQRERLSDAESRKPNFLLKLRFFLESQLSKVYTNDIFLKFQDEVEGMYSCFSIRQMNVEGSFVTFIVKEDVQVEENRKETKEFEVMYNTCDAEVVCVCALFNFRGYLCRHALSVINQIGLEEIPPQYVLARWRKDVERDYSFSYGWDGIDINNPVHRYDSLYKCILKIVEEGRKSHDRYKFTLQSLNEILNKVSS